jgi:hypothetical protein
MKMRTSTFRWIAGIGVIAALLVNAGPGRAEESILGSHIGKVISGQHAGEEVDLMLRAVPGRDGAFLGALIQKRSGKITFYLVDPNRGVGDWVMIPITAAGEGEVMAPSDPNPSLSLTKTVDRHGDPMIVVTSANAGNTLGFQGAIEFPKKSWWKSEYKWTELRGGFYVGDGFDGSANIEDKNLASRNEASGELRLPDISGKFRIRKKVEGLFSLNGLSERATGNVQQSYPARIGVAVQRRNTDYFILVDPANGSARALKRK